MHAAKRSCAGILHEWMFGHGSREVRHMFTKSRAFIIHMGIAMVSTLLALLALEFGVRWALADKIVLFPRNHAEARYGDFAIRRMIPDIGFWHESIDGRWHFKINRNGFRDDEDYVYEKPPGAFRVLALGDSHTAGFEVAQNETFSAQLEAELRRRGIEAEVLNTGISGFGTAEQVVFLENEGLKFRPDAVVVAFYANDYSDNLRSGLFRLNDGRLEVASKRYAPAVEAIALTHAIPGLKWLSENSYAYSLAFNAVWEFFKGLSVRKAETEYAVPVEDVRRIEIDMAAALLNRLAQSCRKSDIPCILADIPMLEGASGYVSSLKPALLDQVSGNYRVILTSKSYLGSRPAEAVFVPHGHRHISAQTHRALAHALAERLAAGAVRTARAPRRQ